MAHDDSDFEKLLKEAREWDARDRARHPTSTMKDEGGPEPFATRPRPPAVTVEELQKRERADLRMAREAPTIETPKPSTSIKMVLKGAMKQAKSQQATERAKPKGGGWGWIIWALVIGYFVFKR